MCEVYQGRGSVLWFMTVMTGGACLKICRLVLTSGNGNSIFRSIRPGRISAGSSDSILFVAMITFTSPRVSKPSSWFNSSNIVRWISRSPPDVESYLCHIVEPANHTKVASRNAPFCTDCVNFVNEDYTWRVLLRHAEQFAVKFRTVTEVFLY